MARSLTSRVLRICIPQHRRPKLFCGRRYSSSHHSDLSNNLSALLVQPQWQGEGGAHAVGISRGCNILASVFSDLLPSSARRVDVPVECPRARAHSLLTNQVWWHEDLVKQTRSSLSCLDDVQPGQVFAAGGDCSVDLAPCGWLLERYGGDIAVLSLDAHADLNVAGESPSGHFHGMWLRALLGDAPTGLSPRRRLVPSQLVYAGLRELDPSEADCMARWGIQSLSPAALEGTLGSTTLCKFFSSTGCSRLHVHLDLDVLDPSVFPHVSVPSPGGLGVNQLGRILRDARTCLPVVGLTVTELRIDDARDDDFCRDVLLHLLGPQGIDVSACVLTHRHSV